MTSRLARGPELPTLLGVGVRPSSDFFYCIMVFLLNFSVVLSTWDFSELCFEFPRHRTNRSPPACFDGPA